MSAHMAACARRTTSASLMSRSVAIPAFESQTTGQIERRALTAASSRRGSLEHSTEPPIMVLLCQSLFGLGGQDWDAPHRVGGQALIKSPLV